MLKTVSRIFCLGQWQVNKAYTILFKRAYSTNKLYNTLVWFKKQIFKKKNKRTVCSRNKLVSSETLLKILLHYTYITLFVWSIELLHLSVYVLYLSNVDS